MRSPAIEYAPSGYLSGALDVSNVGAGGSAIASPSWGALPPSGSMSLGSGSGSAFASFVSPLSLTSPPSALAVFVSAGSSSDFVDASSLSQPERRSQAAAAISGRVRTLGWYPGLLVSGLVLVLSLLSSAPTPSARKEAIIIMNEGVDLASQGDNAKAKAKLQAATKADPTYAYAWLNLGIVLQREGALTEAASAFESGVAHAEDAAKDELQYRLAITTYREASRPSGSRAERRKAIDNALKLLTEVTKASPKRSDAHLYRARCLEELDQPTEADLAYRAAIDADPGNVTALVELGNMYIDYGHPNVGLAVLEAATKAHATDAESWSALGRAYLSLEKPDDAVDAFKKAVTVDPEHLPRQYGLGMAYAEKRDRKMAIERLNEFLRLAGDDVPEMWKKAANNTIARMQDVI